MHDWTLLSVLFEWGNGQTTLSFKNQSGDEVLVAHSVVELHLTQFNEWGPSVSVSEVRGPYDMDNGLQSIEIEMQSGDVVKVTAKSFQMPHGVI